MEVCSSVTSTSSLGVTQAVENLKKDWSQVVTQLEVCIAAIESCGKMGKGIEKGSSLPRLNGSAQDALQLLNALQCRLDLLAEQLPSFEEVQSGQATLGSWKGPSPFLDFIR